jgi:hypothetical protein
LGKLPPERCYLIPARARAVACTRRAWRAREATPRAEIAHSARDAARARGDMRAAVRRARRARARGGARGTHRARVMAPWRWLACCVGRACARGRLLEGGGVRANLTLASCGTRRAHRAGAPILPFFYRFSQTPDRTCMGAGPLPGGSGRLRRPDNLAKIS